MKKLEDIIQKAILCKQNWCEKEFSRTLDILRHCENISIVWDNEANENWASIIKSQAVIALISQNLPLGFIREPYFEEIASIINNTSFQLEAVEDFDSPDWFIESKDIFDLIGWHASKEAVDINRFSISDFTYATM